MRLRPAFALAVVVGSTSAFGFKLSYSENRIYVPFVEGGGGRTDLNPDHVYQILGTHTHAATAKSLIEASYGDWNVSISSSQAPGAVTVTEYAAYQA